MNYDINNIFAKIIRNEIPSDKIYEDDLLLIIKDSYFTYAILIDIFL